MKYICTDDSGEQIYGIGNSLEDAYEDLQMQGSSSPIPECTFYEVTEIEVEAKIQKVCVPVKSTSKRN
jgi:hypothetical protein